MQTVKKADFSIRTASIETLLSSRIFNITYANTRSNQTVTRCRIHSAARTRTRFPSCIRSSSWTDGDYPGPRSRQCTSLPDQGSTGCYWSCRWNLGRLTAWLYSGAASIGAAPFCWTHSLNNNSSTHFHIMILKQWFRSCLFWEERLLFSLFTLECFAPWPPGQGAFIFFWYTSYSRSC